MKSLSFVRSWKERLFYTDRPDDDRRRIRGVIDSLVLHLHPTRVPANALRLSYTWGLGGLSTMLALVIGLTGVLLMFRYEPTIDRAYVSIQLLETQVAFGSLVRAVHHWSANLLVITTFLHLLRVFFTGGYKRGRAVNWLIGIGLFLLVMVFNFTGYLLPWDQLAYWAITVSTSLISYVPLVGESVSAFLRAGSKVGQGALGNFYALHVAVLPAVAFLTLGYHFWKVRKDGGISQPDETVETKRPERVTTIPHLTRIEFAAAAVLLVGILVFAMLVPAPLEALANPAQSPNPAKAAWYFVGLQELLLHMHSLAAMGLMAAVLLGMAILPRWDSREDNIGVYFRSRRGRRAAIAGLLLSVDLVPLLVLIDEFWLDWPAMLPTLPTLISVGLVPLLVTLLGLAAIYFLSRLLFRADHSEALVGLFTFVMTSLVVLTVIGNFFRGANMALVLPF
ncbi:MAG: cytochrome b N-terminal domain-containing protein [Chloroflexota bacterium]